MNSKCTVCSIDLICKNLIAHQGNFDNQSIETKSDVVVICALVKCIL